MEAIARALGRPPSCWTDTQPMLHSRAADTTKYFACELGSLAIIEPDKDRYIVNGDHTAVRLQDLLDGFIKKYVLCVNCSNPETNMVGRVCHLRARSLVAVCDEEGEAGGAMHGVRTRVPDDHDAQAHVVHHEAPARQHADH